MSTPKIGIIVGSTREGRMSEKAADWLLGVAKERADLTFEKVDLRHYPLPFFDMPRSPIFAPLTNDVAKKWSAKITELDGAIFVNGEYNHSFPAVLKNALDFTYAEWARKPAAFMGYGNAGGARAIEQLRMVLIELGAAPLRASIHVGPTEARPIFMGQKTFEDHNATLVPAATKMFDELAWWAKALKAQRAA